MQFINVVTQKAAEFAKDNATTLLTAGGVVGAVGTAVAAWRGGYKYAEILGDVREELMNQDATNFAVGHEEDGVTISIPVIPFKDKVMLIAPHIAPPILTGSLTITAIIMANRMSAQKAAALAAAYGLAERNFSDYRAKVEEKLTGPKNAQITEELAQEAVDKTPGSDRIVIVEGEVLCLDKPTGRYFNSTMESIRQAVNTTNAEIFNHGFTTLNFFYEELDLKPTTWAGEVGFDGDNILELDISTALAPGNRPCITIDFKSMPKTESSSPKYA